MQRNVGHTVLIRIVDPPAGQLRVGKEARHSAPIVVGRPRTAGLDKFLAPLMESWSMMPAVTRPARSAIHTALVGE